MLNSIMLKDKGGSIKLILDCLLSYNVFVNFQQLYFVSTFQLTLFQDLVVDYASAWLLARDNKAPWPKPLRLMLMGSPGSGKSSSVKDTVRKLYSILGSEFDDLVKQATPTGAASYQMSAGSTTVHKLFGLHIKSKRTDISRDKVKFLTDKF